MTESLARVAPKEFHYVSKDVYTDTTNLDLLASLYTSKQLDFGTDDIENRIKAEVVMKHIRIQEYFRDYDKLRKGVITKDQVS